MGIARPGKPARAGAVFLMLRRLAAALAVLALAAACGNGADERPIPPGRYLAPDAAEWLQVGPDTILFHVRYRLEQPEAEFIDRAYEYRVGKDGVIYLSMSSNEWAYLEFFPNPWVWRNGAIVRIAPDDGTETRFATGGR